MIGISAYFVLHIRSHPMRIGLMTNVSIEKKRERGYYFCFAVSYILILPFQVGRIQ